MEVQNVKKPDAVLDFGFAFNNSSFSDRILRIEILGETRIGELQKNDVVQNHKRRRLHEIHKELESCVHHEHEAVSVSRSVKTIHINSAVLASKSLFFLKLFSNGMRESENRQVTLKINDSEEAAFIGLLHFMYSNTLPETTTVPALLDILMTADMYEVASCVKYCSGILSNLAKMSPDYALLYLELPTSISMPEPVQQLADAAKQYLIDRYKDITKCQDEALKLPLVGIELIFSSDDLQVDSEDVVYDFIMKWARTHFQKEKERKKVLGTRLHQLIRFPFISSWKLKKVSECSDFEPNIASKIVRDALLYKLKSARSRGRCTKHLYVERAYKFHPVRVVRFEHPLQQCVVYLDLKREKCAKLHPSGEICSQKFSLDQQKFELHLACNMDQQSQSLCFGMYLKMDGKETDSCTVEYEFAARSNPTKYYVNKHKCTYTSTGGNSVGCWNLFSTPWSSFMADESQYFIDGVLYLRAEVSIKP